MAVSLFREVKRAETQLEKAFAGSRSEDLSESRRRLRLDLLRQHFSSAVGSLKARDGEGKATDEGVPFLWRVRNELHFIAGHKNDVLSRDLQSQIAKNFGYRDDGDTLGVEKFMREYYLHARTIHR